MRKPKLSKGDCSTPTCWETAKTAGFCAACYSGWRRLSLMTVPEIAIYLRRTTRLNRRAVGAFNRKRRKVA